MAVYEYERADGSRFDHEFPFGEAPREFDGGRMVMGGHLQFTYGKDAFHGASIKELQERQVSEARRNGVKNLEPVGPRWV